MRPHRFGGWDRRGGRAARGVHRVHRNDQPRAGADLSSGRETVRANQGFGRHAVAVGQDLHRLALRQHHRRAALRSPVAERCCRPSWRGRHGRRAQGRGADRWRIARRRRIGRVALGRGERLTDNSLLPMDRRDRTGRCAVHLFRGPEWVTERIGHARRLSAARQAHGGGRQKRKPQRGPRRN